MTKGWGTQMMPGHTRIHYYEDGHAVCGPAKPAERLCSSDKPMFGDACMKCEVVIEGFSGARVFSSKG